ncbi:MAG: hypothetical protein EBT34_14595 [Acetobacteraceae bacterium]|nr:hypothetical protein [Acetobacteraceae bacterium]
MAKARCTDDVPSFEAVSQYQKVACHFWKDGLPTNRKAEGQTHATL